jgi:hypothetical protein
MEDSVVVLKFSDVKTAIATRRSHVLLGNGFSIACDPIFRYQSLFEAAVNAGLSEKAQAAFSRLGTNNFEGVLRLLEDANWLCTEYGIIHPNTAQLEDDIVVVKNTLVEAVTASHLEHSGMLSDHKKESAREFLKPFHNIFTTNYDLLLYWTVLSGGKVSHGDGFRSDEDDPEAPYVVFTERLGSAKGIFFLHGALHLHVKGGQLRKHCWNRTQRRLTDQVRESLGRSEYPLIVAEGTPDKKLEQIERNGYLWYALDKLHRIQGPLVIFGHSLGPSDQHVVNAVAAADDLDQVFVSLHGDPDAESNLQIRAAVDRMKAVREDKIALRGRGKSLQVQFFDADSARPWG